MKICNKCLDIKNLTEFVRNKTRPGGLHNWCKECTRAARRVCKTKQKADLNWRIKNREKIKAAYQKQKLADPHKLRLRHRRCLTKQKYGITYEMLEEKIAIQNFKCAICSHPIHLGYRGYAIDHDHETGFLREILCSQCNLGLGSFKDNTLFLQNAIKYLEKWA